jgi:protoheme IX farnesyltransferase
MKAYINLTKPGIILGNAITAAAGFFMVAESRADLDQLLGTLVGLSLIIASACVMNNIYDRHIDALMSRTKNRAVASGLISIRNAAIFAAALGILGIAILYSFTSFLTLSVALLGMVVYVLLYTPLKSRSVFATLIGSISGATPPVVGYTAVTNQWDIGATLLFIILICWQMPHFYAIAIRRMHEYQHAAIPVLPLVQGLLSTKIHMLFYAVAFLVSTSLLTFYRFTGYTYLIVMLILGGLWVWFCIRGFRTPDNSLWAQKMFKYSLVVLLVFSILISIDTV